MIDFIEIHAVAEGVGPVVTVRLVEQGRVVRRVQGGHRAALPVQEHQFQQRGLVILQGESDLGGQAVQG